MKTVLVVTPLVIFPAVLGFVIGGGAGGTAGTVISTAAVLVAARFAMPRLVRPDPPDLPAAEENFPRYRELSSMLSWSGRSARYFNVVLRPVLSDVASAELLRCRRIDMIRDPDEAVDALSAPVWELVDPSVPRDTPVTPDAAGIDAALDALEGLRASTGRRP